MGTKKAVIKYENLDILRWIAATTVLLYHLRISIEYNSSPGFSFSSITNYPFPGTMCVFIFFILSGYVISLNHPTLKGKGEVVAYIKKRLVRIVPIYTVSILLVLLALPGSYSAGTILSNLFYMSVPLKNVLFANSPLWSLHFEMLYYLLYIPIARLGINLRYLLLCNGIAIAALFLFFHNAPFPPLLISYINGFFFWIVGAYIARYSAHVQRRLVSSRFIAIFLLTFSVAIVNPYADILSLLHLKMYDHSPAYIFHTAIPYDELCLFPQLVLLILAAVHAYKPVYNFIVYGVYLVGLAKFAHVVRYYWQLHQLAVSNVYFIPLLLFVASICCWLYNGEINTVARHWIKSTIPLADISYGIYIIHMPFIFLFAEIPVFSFPAFVLRTLGCIAAIIAAAYILERRFQPWVRRLLGMGGKRTIQKAA